MATAFLQWNAHSNIPNILRHLSERVEKLQTSTKEAADMIGSFRDTVKEANESSTKLATALNRFTRALVIVGAIGLLVQAAYVGFIIWTHFDP
jgi:hypothetical protein